jgi:PAT family beta-lactamase induction signal transducer AmpG
MTSDPRALRRLAACVLLGFGSGLPLYVLVTLVPAWLRLRGVDLTTIGLLALVGLPYTWKFAWSPLLDRFAPLGLDRRRGWALLTQAALVPAMAALGRLDPDASLDAIIGLCLAVAVASATQDVALDAWRRELLESAELGLGTALFVNAYRAAQLVPGSLGLVLADHLAWSDVFLVVAAFQGLGVLGALLAPTPSDVTPPRTLAETVVGPVRELLGRGARTVLPILAFLLLYKLGDSLSTALVTPFWLDLGFDKPTIAAIRPIGLAATVTGGFVGGLAMTCLGLRPALAIFGAVQLVGTLGYGALAWWGPDPSALVLAVVVDDLGQGLGATALVAWAQTITDRRFTATQFALFSSITAVPRTLLNAGTGGVVEAVGWPIFFVLCGVAALPGLALIPFVAVREGAHRTPG